MDSSLGARRLRRVSLPTVRTLRVLYLLAGASAGALSLAFGQSQNFHVFADAARALVRSEDLYALRSADYFKYSPTFALLFLPFAWMPAWLGATLWSLVNFAFAFAGIDRVIQDDRQKRLVLSVALAGILLVTDGDQSNLLVAGAMLLALDAFERGRARAGACLVVGAGFIKIFPFAAAAFAVFDRQRWRTVLYLLAFAIGLGAVPLLVCGPRTLLAQYASWGRLVARDHDNHGWSVMSVLQDTLHVWWPSAYVQGAAAVVQTVPLALGARFGTDAYWRRTFACTLFAFFVLFNHRTEYTTFVLAAMASAIWWGISPVSWTRTALVAFVLLAPGPFFAWPDPSVSGPLSFVAAHRMFHPLRVLPLFVAWAWMIGELVQRLATRRDSRSSLESGISDVHAR
jgi:hypothetical protein